MRLTMRSVVYYYNNVPVEKEAIANEQVETLRIGDVIKRGKKEWTITDIRAKPTITTHGPDYFTSVYLTGPL
jgi:molybdenum cofactor biosynthesis enzyme